MPTNSFVLAAALAMRTRTTLRLEKGATLKATNDPADYARY
jgi:polygalacturonase